MADFVRWQQGTMVNIDGELYDVISSGELDCIITPGYHHRVRRERTGEIRLHVPRSGDYVVHSPGAKHGKQDVCESHVPAGSGARKHQHRTDVDFAGSPSKEDIHKAHAARRKEVYQARVQARRDEADAIRNRGWYATTPWATAKDHAAHTARADTACAGWYADRGKVTR